MEKLEYKGLSKRAKLLLSRQESYDVDFKRAISGLDSEDFVAFANSRRGGTLLIGVDETETPDGRQRGKIVGCPVGDKEKLSIISRAESCIPAIEIKVIVENAGALPFFRIEIPSGPQKPYCTSRGTYKIRGDGINFPLTPQRLLTMFLESESQEFIEKFRDATEDLEQKLGRLFESSVTLEEVLSRTFASARNAESLADETSSASDAVLAAIRRLDARVAQLEAHTAELRQSEDLLFSRQTVENDD